MDKLLKGIKILTLNSFIFCDIIKAGSMPSGKDNPNKSNTSTDGNSNSNSNSDKKEETPEEKEKKELEQFKKSVSDDFKKNVKFEEKNLVSLSVDKKNNDTGSIFHDNTDSKVNPNALKKEDEWFTYNSIFNFTDKLKEFVKIVTKNDLEPNDENNEEKLSEIYSALIKTTIDELKKHLNFKINTVKNNIELVNQLNIEIKKGVKFIDFFQKYLNGVITGKLGLSNFHLINDAKSVELYLDDISTSYFDCVLGERKQIVPKFISDKNVIATDEAKVKIQEYRDKSPKFRLKNDVDIIYDNNEYNFCEFGTNEKHAGLIKDKNNKEQLDKEAFIAQIEYLNKVIKSLIGVENAIDVKTVKNQDDILEQLSKYSEKEVTPGTYRVLLKSRVSDNRNLGFIVLRDKTTS